MKKISLVKLSQMEVKPSKVWFDEKLYVYDDEEMDYVYDDDENHFTYQLHHDIPFYEYNNKIIEIEEEPLLTDEEKEFLEIYLKFSGYRIDEISKNKHTECLAFLSNNLELEHLCYQSNNMFKNMKHNKIYTLKELGLSNDER